MSVQCGWNILTHFGDGSITKLKNGHYIDFNLNLSIYCYFALPVNVIRTHSRLTADCKIQFALFICFQYTFGFTTRSQNFEYDF